MSQEHDFEPIRGLPSDLPEGETILWQGEPDWIMMARRVFRVDWVALYFVLLMVWRVFDAGQSIGQAVTAALWVAPIGIVGLAILGGLAFLNSRTTVYTLTNHRLVMRFGAALTKAINIPFKIIESAAVNQKADGSGDIAIQLVKPNKISVILLWPHARPGFISQPQPSLRCLKDAGQAAAILGEALRAAHDQASAQVTASRTEETVTSATKPAKDKAAAKRGKTAGVGPSPALA